MGPFFCTETCIGVHLEFFPATTNFLGQNHVYNVVVLDFLIGDRGKVHELFFLKTGKMASEKSPPMLVISLPYQDR